MNESKRIRYFQRLIKHAGVILFCASLAFGQLPKPGGGVGGALIPSGSSLPATCQPPQLFVRTGQAATATFYGCISADNWEVLGDGTGTGTFGEASLAGLANNQTLWDGANASRTLTFGLSGASDPTLTFSNGVINVSTGALQVGGAAVVTGALNSGRVALAAGASSLTDDSGLAFNTLTDSLGVIGNVTVGQTGTATGEVKINGITSGTVTVKSADIAGTWTMTLPANDGGSNECLKTDGSGVTSWGACGTGSGAAAYTDLTDSQVTLDTGTDTVTIAAGKVQINGVSTDAPASSQTLTSPNDTTGTVWIGVDSAGALTAWHDLTGLTCSAGITCSSGATGFPADTIPLASCAVASSNFTACTDARAPLSLDTYEAGTLLTRSGRTISGGPTIVSFSSSTSDASGPCVVGTRHHNTSTNKSWDCTSADTWTEVTGGGSSADDTAYNATTWNGSTAAPTQNATRDYFETLAPSGVVASSHGGLGTDASAFTGIGRWASGVPSAVSLTAPAVGQRAVTTNGDNNITTYSGITTGINSDANQIAFGGTSVAYTQHYIDGSGNLFLGLHAPILGTTPSGGMWQLYMDATGGVATGLDFKLRRNDTGTSSNNQKYVAIWKRRYGSMSVGQAACDPGSLDFTFLAKDCEASGANTDFRIEGSNGQTATNDVFSIRTHSASHGQGTAVFSINLNGLMTLPANVRQTFKPGANAAGLNVGCQANAPDTPSNGDLYCDSDDGAVYVRAGGSWISIAAAAGDVTAASSFGTDNRLIRSDGTGKGVQSTGITVDDSDNVSGAATLAVGTTPASAGIHRLPNNQKICWRNASDNGDICIYVGSDDEIHGEAPYNSEGSTPGPYLGIEASVTEPSSAGQYHIGVETDHLLKWRSNGQAQRVVAIGNATGQAVGDDTAYNATSWNGATEAPTKNAVRDYIESIAPSGVATTAATANAGDSATSFFSTGTIEDARLPASMADKTITGSLAIPQGASPTTDAAGECAVDTTTGQLRCHDGTAARVWPHIQERSFVIPAPAAGDDFPLMKAPFGMSIIAIKGVLSGTTNVIGQLQECNSSGASCVDLDADITFDGGEDGDDGSLTDSTIALGNWIAWKTTSVSGTPTFLTVTFTFRVVAD